MLSVSMQSSIDGDWWSEEDPETVELAVGIEGTGSLTHEIPVGMLEQEFESDESRREYIEEQLQSLAFTLSVEWRKNQ